ncbi:hypothetical protein Goshw_019006 [Gossypium schwendimanii]|uniref:Uncharacterized protein n=2 Tax=Gossypium TaxID=3633 RepID=A0A7J9KY39_GOSSC|nr:hypothetical protein [Gossypium lobatum]MBA0851380.1 hypothetical protein [Gossypium schwendimanii]
MPLETNKPDQSNVEGDKQRHFNKEIKDMVSSITRRVTGIHKPGSSHRRGTDDDDEHSVGIITLAGNNVGATMRSELDEKSSPQYRISVGDDEADAMSTYVNSNFQAVNNSIMLGSSYSANDPGVHLDISGVGEHEGKKPADKTRRRGKEKREGFLQK